MGIICNTQEELDKVVLEEGGVDIENDGTFEVNRESEPIDDASKAIRDAFFQKHGAQQ